MNIEQIRNNAPKGATHYLIINGEVVYYRYPYSMFCRYFDGLNWCLGNPHTYKKALYK